MLSLATLGLYFWILAARSCRRVPSSCVCMCEWALVCIRVHVCMCVHACICACMHVCFPRSSPLVLSGAFKATPEAAVISQLPHSILPLLSDQSRPAQTTNPASLSELSGSDGTLYVLLAWLFSWGKTCFLKRVLLARFPWPMVKIHSNQIGGANFKCFSLDTYCLQSCTWSLGPRRLSFLGSPTCPWGDIRSGYEESSLPLSAHGIIK